MPKRTLLLSSSHEPLAFMSFKRTYSILRRGVAEVLGEWDELLTGDVKLPATMRLNDFVLARTPHKRCSYNRQVILARDGYRCQYCDRKLNYRDATIDHVVPRSRGGGNNWTNCVAACKPCNRRKGNRLHGEAGLILLRKPKLPGVVHYWYADIGGEPSNLDWHAQWNEFVPA